MARREGAGTMTLLVTDLAALMSSPAALVLEAGVAAPVLSLALWRVAALENGDWLLHPEGAPAVTGVPLPAAPAGVLAVLAPAMPDWLAHWPDEAPPLLADAAALAALLATRMLAMQQDNAVLRAGLVALRIEHEDARTAMARWMQASGQGWPEAPELMHGDAPVPAPPLPLGRTRRRRLLPVEVGGLSAVGLHLAQAECGPGTQLRLRLVAHESGRNLGAWLVPGEVLRPGWLMLDLPMPVQPRRESAAIEIDIDLGGGDALALSEGPALRLFRTGGTPRFVQPAHWEGAAQGMLLPPPGVRLGLPPHIWQGVPRHLTLAPGETREMLMPALPVLGLDMLHARLRLVGGSAMQAALACPGGATGWRDFDGDGALEMAMALPVAAPPTLPLRLLLRQIGPSACGVEWQELAGSRLVA
jgi:hypothetical protein